MRRATSSCSEWFALRSPIAGGHDAQPRLIQQAQLAGFENLFTASVVARRPESGVMQCRLEGGAADLEVPLGLADVGASVRIAVRAGDILLASEQPRGLSARNVLPGVLRSLKREGTTVIATVGLGPIAPVNE
mgnify:CR=1 FL=1